MRSRPRRLFHRRLAVRTSFAVLVAATAQSASAVPQFTLVDLGTLGGGRSKAFDISNSGRIVGFAHTPAGEDRAFRTAAYSAIDPASDSLGTLSGGSRSYAYSINASGNVAGDGNLPTSGDRAYRYTTSMQSLGTLGGDWSYAFGINDSNQVVGGSASKRGASSDARAFLYSGAQMYSLGTLGGNNSWAHAINNNGYVAGYSQNDPSSHWIEHAFLWSPATPNATTGTMIDLGTLGGTYSYAWSLNDQNQVVGGAHLAGDAEYHAFRYWNGARIDLGTLGGAYSEAYDINLGGEIVGASDDGSGESRAFLYTNGTMYNLNDLIPAGSGWVLQHARAVNDSGYIVGYGINPAGETRAFLLSPDPRDSVWNVDANGQWSAVGNWSNGVPNGIGKVANFGSAISAPRTIDVDAPHTVGRITFDNLHSYTLAGSGPVTLDDSTGGASAITVLSGNHAVAVPLVLNGSLSVDALPLAATLTISGSISGAGAAVTKGGAGTVVLSGANSYSGNTVIDAGVLSVGSAASLGSPTNAVVLRGGTLRAAGAIASAGRNISVEQAGGTVDANGFDSTFGAVAGAGTFTKQSPGTLTVQHVRVADLVVSGGLLRVASNGGNAGASVVDSLVISGGSQFDLRDNKLIVQAGDVGSFDGTHYGGLTAQVASAYNSGAWNGPGLMTSEPNAAASVGVTTIGIATAAQVLFIDPAETGIFAGQTVSGASVIAVYTYAADLNIDGRVDAQDLGIIDNWVQFPGTSGWANGDLNYDGIIDAVDYGILDNTMPLQGPPILMSDPASAVSAVPEPLSVAVLALLAPLSIADRRRRSASPA